MTPSTRKASAKQVQVLHAILHQGLNTTAQIHKFREEGLRKADKPAEKQRGTYELLNTCHRYEWVERINADEEARSASPNDGSGYEWIITEAGKTALERGFAAVQQQQEEESDVNTTTEAPPASTPAWGAGATTEETEPTTAPDPDLQALDNEGDDDSQEETVDPSEIEIDEPKETRHTTEGKQLQFTLKIGGAKPTSSTLKINAKQVTFEDREFAKGDVIQFTGEIRIVAVGARDKKQGTERFHQAVVDVITLADA